MVYGYDTAFKIALSQNRTTIKAIAEIFVSRLVDYRQEALVSHGDARIRTEDF